VEALRVKTALKELGATSIGASGAAPLAEALGVNTTLTRLDLGNNSIGAAGSAALAEAVTSNPFALMPFTAAGRLAFFSGRLRRRTHQQSPLTKLPLDMVSCILTRYKVAQGRRKWASGKMSVVEFA
jgi:hypothetical protein